MGTNKQMQKIEPSILEFPPLIRQLIVILDHFWYHGVKIKAKILKKMKTSKDVTFLFFTGSREKQKKHQRSHLFLIKMFFSSLNKDFKIVYVSFLCQRKDRVEKVQLVSINVQNGSIF